MPRRAEPLTAQGVKTVKPGRHCDGHGLYLDARDAEHGWWVFRFKLQGRKLREMGLGPARGRNAVPLKDARTKAAELHRLVRAGVDPLEQRDAKAATAKAEKQAQAARSITFKAVAQFFMGSHEAGWKNEKHRQQWANTLATYAHPTLGDLPVGSVGTEHVMQALEPIWRTKAETASRVRGRIESVLDYAKARGWRDGENPARWRGHLDNLLPARSKVARVEHHAALPWREVGAFMVELRKQGGIGARALEFCILTAARSGEVRGARWAEIDWQEKLWTIPAGRMKAGRLHRVPLPGPAVDVLQQMQPLAGDGHALIFPGAKEGKPLSDMSLTAVLRRMNRGDLTAHGFRSTFRDWCAESTNFSREVAESALAHVLKDKTEAAYQRGDLFDKRRQ
ncbi:MAG TPA: integrase arm-type DNA-binding domain-containing protein, partial [Acetobacteraceae bacterium]|nr:integrase arm-type DNA-binding domain-containing protein [Acetobacteraceae bacterium]